MSSADNTRFQQRPRRPERVLKVVFGLVLVLPLLAWCVISYQTYRTLDADARERTHRLADLLHEHALKVFETQVLVADQAEQILFGLTDAQIIARTDELWPRLRALTGRLPQLQDIWVIDAKGFPLVVTNLPKAPRDIDLSDRTYFQVHRDGRVRTGDVYVSNLLQGRADPSRVFFQLSRVRQGDGDFRGVIALSIEPNYFSTFYAQAAEEEFAFLALIRDDGNILAHDSAVGTAAGDVFRAAVANSPDRGFFVDAASDRYVAYRKVAAYPVYVLVGFDRSSIAREWRAQSFMHLYFGVPAVIGLLTLIVLARRQNRREYASLAKLQREMVHRQELEAQLHHSQRLESLGRLTGGVAHDFNNLLAVVSGSLELLRKRVPPELQREHQFIDRALAGVARGSQLNRRLLSFARQQKLDPECVDAHAVICEVAEMARLSVDAQVTIDVEPAREATWIRIDRGQFETALLNLCINARDAMPDGGRVVLSTERAHLDEAAARRHQLAGGSYCLVRVADTGEGMSPEVLGKAAEPFFTTKPPGFGTGLGLSQVHGFITQSGGRMRIDSSAGVGTMIDLYLPLEEPPAAQGAGEDDTELPRGRDGETILVVDDDASIRRLTAEALRDLGYASLTAKNLHEALDVLREAGAVTAVLTDVTMAGGDGWRLSEEIAALHPDLPVAFMTGFNPGEDRLTERHLVLRKPFSMADLARLIRCLLDGTEKVKHPSS
jgi:two-component system NtrC family sensor kinase